MPTIPNIHEDIEPWLAAAVHDQLSEEERAQFQEHLASCESCRRLHQEELTMSQMISSTLQEAKPDLAFEQRIVSGFRRKVPTRAGFPMLFNNFFRNRATQLTAVAAVLLGLVQLGRMVTGEDTTGPKPTLTVHRDLLTSTANESDDVRGEIQQAPSAAQSGASRGGANSKTAKVKTEPTKTYSSNGAAAPASVAKSAPEATQSFAAADSGSASADAPAELAEEANDREDAERERVIVTGSNIPTAEEVGPAPRAEPSAAVPDNRKLVRNAQVQLEIIKFDDALQKIIAFAAEDRGYVATSSSQKQANGKLHGEVVVKVLPENLDRFLLKLRGLGELKNQTLGTEDVTKQCFDTDSRLKNARVMEQRLIDILKTKSTKVADLLEVEKELGRVRASIEEMQGALKYMDAQVQFANVTITLAERDMDEPAAFLLKRRARLALFSTDVEKTFAEVKGVVEGAKAQLSSSTLDRDSSGEATARLVLLIVPEEADALIERIKGMGRVQNYNEQTDRVAQGGTGMAQGAKVERDKVELSITISRNEQEPALQTTSLSILTSAVGDKVARLKENAAKANAEIRSSSFSRDPDGQEIANITLRVAMKNYAALLSSLDQLGKVKDVSVQREDRRGVVNEETAPADISIQVYSQPNIVSDETGLFATVRRTLAQGASALMWSLRMIGVALAFLAPWVLAFVLVIWVLRKLSRRRAARSAQQDAAE